MASGDELLIVDASDADRAGLAALFEADGYVCTSLATGAEALDRLERKLFPAALIDLDVDGPAAGLDLVRALRERAPHTSIVLLTGRRSFEGALEAYRLGVVDVVPKKPDQIAYLRRRVGDATDRFRATDTKAQIMRDAQHVLEEAFKAMIALGRRVYGTPVSGATGTVKPRVLVADLDPASLDTFRKAFHEYGWELVPAVGGGAALDVATRESIDLAIVRDELGDLSGPMVLKSLQATRAELHGLLFTAPGAEGRLERYSGGRRVETLRPYRGVAHLIAVAEPLLGKASALHGEKRFLQQFRADHAPFLKKYAELKMKLDSTSGS